MTSALAVAMIAAVPAVAAGVAASPAAKGKVLILKPLVLTRISDLDMGFVIPTGGGWVKLDPDTNSRTTSGAGVTLVTSHPGAAAQFAGAGSPGQLVVLTKSFPALLNGPAGDSVQFLAMTFDQADSPIRFADLVTKTFTVAVGGTMFIRANQTDGVYTGTFTVTATYF